MKVWSGYGSEHSMNLVMIGRFKEARDAEKAKRVIDCLTKLITELDVRQSDTEFQRNRFSDEVLEILKASNLYILDPTEMEQFSYDVSVAASDREVVVTTNEVDVSAFLKVLLDNGARIEVYSAHDYPKTGYGRGG